MTGFIPVRNIFYMLLYAWNKWPQSEPLSVGGVQNPTIADLLASVLADECVALDRRGLGKGYIEHRDVLATPRGRLLLGETINQALLSRAKISCSFDELTLDSQENRILKGTLIRLLRCLDIHKELLRKIRNTLDRFGEVTLIEIGPRDFQSLIIHRHNAHYSLALKICELIVNSLAPEAGGSRYRFKDIAADEQRMGLIFQSFILNFYKRERPDYRVKSDRLSWNFTTASGQSSHLLPTMNTDVSLYSREKVILIECKWTREPLQHFRGSPSFRSAHLYQLYAYLRNHPSSSRQRVSGILLYPQVDEELRADYSIENHELSVRTLDLSADWHHIRTALQELINRRPPMLPMPTGAQAEHL